VSRQKPKLGTLELQVLKVIWGRQPCTVQEVAEYLGDSQGYARTTILTIMQRLHEKGFLKRRKREGVYHYAATRDRRSTISGLIEQFVETVLDNSKLPLVTYLADSEELSNDQIAEIRKIVENLESGKAKQ